jgi:hypothetical protein
MYQVDNVRQLFKRGPEKVDPVTVNLHHTMETITECLNMFKQAHPTSPNVELFGSLMFLIVKNESRLERGATPEQLLAACRKHLTKGQ